MRRGQGRRGAALRILQVIDHLGLGGAQSLVLGTARLGAEEGFETYVASVEAGGDPALVRRLQECSSEVISLNGRAVWDLRALARLVRIVRERKIDVIHSHLAVADVLGGVAGKLTRRPVVASLHNVVADRYSHPLPRRLLAMGATRLLADRLIAVSETVRLTHVEQLGVPAKRLQVIRNVPIAPLLLPAGFEVAQKRAALGIETGPVLCAVARLADTKDHATLLRALPAVRLRHPGTVLLVAGDGPHRGELERLSAELGLSDAVRFLGSRGDAVELMAMSDVVCNLTLAFEGLPIAVLDAMSLGVPLLATRVDGVEEVVEDGEHGLLVPAQDVAAVTQALDTLLDDPGRARRMGEAARESITAQLDPQAWIREIQAVYRELADGASDAQRLGSHLR